MGRSSVTRRESGTNIPRCGQGYPGVAANFLEIESETELRYGVDRPTDAENSQSGEQELVSDAESLAVEFVIGIAIGVLAIAVIGLRLRKRRRREMEDVIIR
jgi:hypothetical protein